MTDQEIRARLASERDRLDETRDAILSDGDVPAGQEVSLQDLSTVDQQASDTSTETLAMEVDQSLLEQVRSDLDDVDAALHRLDEGTYGKCEACGEPIGQERLEAMPAARYCVRHQQMAEAGGGI